jgi:hypothetical protein
LQGGHAGLEFELFGEGVVDINGGNCRVRVSPNRVEEILAADACIDMVGNTIE